MKHIWFWRIVVLVPFLPTLLSGNTPAQTVGTEWRQATAHAPWSARQQHRVVEFQDKVWILGGAGMGPLWASQKKNDVWSSPDCTSWTKITNAAPWAARANHAAVVFKQKIWVMGGHTSTGLTNDVWTSSDGAAWQAKTPPPWYARYGMGTVVFGDRIWIMGGMVADLENDIWSSADGIDWQRETDAAPWPKRANPQCVVFDNKIWLMGGRGEVDTLQDVWCSENGTSWTLVTSAAPWVGRMELGCAILRENLYILSGAYWNLPDVWSTINGSDWNQQTGAAPWAGRSGMQCAIGEDRIWIFGGTYGSSSEFIQNDIWCSDQIAPVITLNPLSSGANLGKKMSLTVEATGIEPLAFQWFRDGLPIENGGFVTGATSATLTITNVQTSDFGDYRCRVTNWSQFPDFASSAMSTTATLILNVLPKITAEPAPQVRNSDETAAFTVTATGTAPLVYTWRKDGHALVNGGRFSGANTNSLTIERLQESDAGLYSCRVANGAGHVDSRDTTLTVHVLPFMIQQPAGQTFDPGTTATLTIQAGGTGPFSYAWRKNGQNLAAAARIQGTLTPSLRISNLTQADEGNYSCLVTSNHGQVLSSEALLEVKDPPGNTSVSNIWVLY